MERSVHFYSGPGYRLQGILYVPDDYQHGEQRPGIVLIGGFTSHHTAPYARRRLNVERLNEAGFVVLGYDPRGRGQSEGPRDRVIPLEEVEDTRNAITFLQTCPEVQPDKVGLYGTSFGGGIATYTAAVDQRVQCMVAINAVGNGYLWLQNLRRLWEWNEFLARLEENRRKRVLTGEQVYVQCREIMLPDPIETEVVAKDLLDHEVTLETAEAVIEWDPEAVADRISPRPALWIAKQAPDVITAPENSERFYHRAKEPKRLVLLDAPGHYDMYWYDETLDHAVAWFQEYLPAAKGAAVLSR